MTDGGDGGGAVLLRDSLRPQDNLRRTGSIALVVGTWLTLVNQGDLLFSGVWSAALAGKIVLNYLTPFTVSNLGLLSRTFQHSVTDGAPHM